MKDPTSKLQMGPQQAVAAGGTSKSGGGTQIKLHMLSYSPVSQKCSNFWQRHHALDAHIPHLYTTAISRFPILLIKNFVTFGLFVFTFSNFIFFIPAGWPTFFKASLNVDSKLYLFGVVHYYFYGLCCLVHGVGVIFSPDTNALNLQEVLEDPPTLPPHPLNRLCFQLLAKKLKYMAPKFKYLTPNK